MDFTVLATAVGTAATGAISASIPVIVIVLGATIGYRLFKRFTK
jgi:Phage major coat protein, Gp8